MVKGTTRQVIVVKSPEPKLFDQAIFLVRDDALTNGGITEEALLKEARQVCTKPNSVLPIYHKLVWFAGGAATSALFWFLGVLL